MSVQTHKGKWVFPIISALVFAYGCSDGASTGAAGLSTPSTSAETQAPTGTSEGSETATGSEAPANQSVTLLQTKEQAARFLNTMTFGASIEDINAAVGRDAADILAEEFAKDPTYILQTVQDFVDAAGRDRSRIAASEFQNSAIFGDDQLRQRMVFALSQIFVVSSNVSNNSPGMAYYVDRLSENAFGNYRDLLEDITLTPNMGEYLTYLRNLPTDLETGRVPDENYAREILQLFSVGLFELENDGTPVLGADGQPIELYTNEDISGLARVFTGIGGQTDFRFQLDRTLPLGLHDNFHDQLEKSFLGLTIPAGTGIEETLNLALDHIANHKNVGPFISRQLIQRFTDSNPPPNYVHIVAEAFDTGTYIAANGRRFGSGQRGDFEATLAAILLDQDLFNGRAQWGLDRGKVREPILHMFHWARAFNIEGTALPVDGASEPGRSFFVQTDFNGFSQALFRAPSVFNFYRPGYIAPGTETGNRGLTVPEFQIFNEGSYIPVANLMMNFVAQSRFNRPFDNWIADYSTEIELADDAAALVDHLNLLLVSGRLTDETKAEISELIGNIEITDAPDSDDRLTRVEAAILAIIARPEFIVWR